MKQTEFDLQDGLYRPMVQLPNTTPHGEDWSTQTSLVQSVSVAISRNQSCAILCFISKPYEWCGVEVMQLIEVEKGGKVGEHLVSYPVPAMYNTDNSTIQKYNTIAQHNTINNYSWITNQ